ncbi:MAG: Arm DNA-binding domain-containing protein [Novosphingobium meiothermophilum]
MRWGLLDSRMTRCRFPKPRCAIPSRARSLTRSRVFPGFYLEVQPNGSKLWRLKYRMLGKEKKLAIGTYPEISLSEARRRRDKAREQLHSGLDPSREKVNGDRRAKGTPLAG